MLIAITHLGISTGLAKCKSNTFLNIFEVFYSFFESMLVTDLYYLPIHNLPQLSQVRGTVVLVIEVVSVFPDVEGQQGFQAFGDGVGGTGFLGDDQGSVSFGGEPYPTATEETNAFGYELFLESVEATPLLLDLFRQRALEVEAGGSWRELGEVKVMVQDLAGVVEHAASGLLHDFLQGHTLKRSSHNEFVKVIHVGLEMFSMMEFKRLGADYGG